LLQIYSVSVLTKHSLRWQVFPYLTGYDYKNSIANGCFFNIGARLARYTSNDTYAQHAEEIWDWITNVGLMDSDYNVYDGGHVGHNCTDINRVQFSYNSAVWLLGAANMYDYVSISHSPKGIRILTNIDQRECHLERAHRAFTESYI
jgi:mannan endo-1,6-alpha-mannosidase